MADYASLTEVHDVLPDLGTDADNLLGKLITRASAMIDSACSGRDYGFGKTTTTVLLDGSNTNILFVPDLVSVSALTLKPSTTGIAATIPSTDYFLGPQPRSTTWPALWLELTDGPTVAGSAWSVGKRNVSITGVFGWPEVPEDIRWVCIQLVDRMWKARASGYNDPGGAAEQGGMPMGRMLTWEHRDILMGYKNVRHS